MIVSTSLSMCSNEKYLMFILVPLPTVLVIFCGNHWRSGVWSFWVKVTSSFPIIFDEILFVSSFGTLLSSQECSAYYFELRLSIYSCCFLSTAAVLIVVFISTDSFCWGSNYSIFCAVFQILYQMEYPWLHILDHVYHTYDQKNHYES